MAYRDFLGLIALIFVTSAILFFWEVIFCMFCYSYTGIRIDRIVPKECAQSNKNFLYLGENIELNKGWYELATSKTRILTM